MADLNYEPFRQNRRIQNAADNAPPLKPGEGDAEAVRILQRALIEAGFPIPDGPTGKYGQQTMAAVQALERQWSLMSDTGIAGRQVIERLDGILAKSPVIVVRPAVLRVVLQSTNTDGGFVHRMYFMTAPMLLGQYQIRIAVQDRREPQIEVAGGTLDPSNLADIAGVREAAEKHTPGLPDQLRVIFCRFRGFAGGGAERFYASTEGGARSGSPYPDYILINVERFRGDGSTFIHEMIHAAGLWDHDPDPMSIFADGSVRSGVNFKPQHAKKVSESFFGR